MCLVIIIIVDPSAFQLDWRGMGAHRGSLWTMCHKCLTCHSLSSLKFDSNAATAATTTTAATIKRTNVQFLGRPDKEKIEMVFVKTFNLTQIWSTPKNGRAK